MLELRIKELLLQKGISKPFAWLRKQGISHTMAKKLLSGRYNRLPLEHLATICEQAWCTPNDLFAWSPPDGSLDQPGHPLQALRRTTPPSDVAKKMEKLTPQQLEEVGRFIEGMGGEGKEAM